MNGIAEALLGWYREHHRDLPWRQTRDPYKIWLSEIILQQTRVDQGMDYYYRFVEHFPTVEDLARSDLRAVLRLWQGLGYYTRARNLHKCARHIVGQLDGAFPESYASLLELPGIGHYTAAAIASFAYGKAVPAIDANAIRVIARLYAMKADPRSPKAAKRIFDIAKDLMPLSSPDMFNQALMEFGALQCTPKSPDCARCPLRAYCEACRTGQVGEIPARKKKKLKRVRFFSYYVIETDQGILMRPRSGKDIWNGLYEFYLIETDKPTPVLGTKDAFLEKVLQGGQLVGTSREYRHILTHQIIMARFFHIRTSHTTAKSQGLAHQYQAFGIESIYGLPKPVLIVRYLEEWRR